MSPASSGPLEVERYIGACLISSQSRHKKTTLRDQFGQGNYNNLETRYSVQRCNQTNDRWAGGMPLISFANQRWRNNEIIPNVPENSQLARLAVHTQGAPLILTNRYIHRKSKAPGTRQNSVNKNVQNVCDTVSVTSDESSGSNNSDTCLPRIIKPRKRRKKDRKPPQFVRPLNQDESTDSAASPEIDSPTNLITFMPFVPYGFDTHLFRVPDPTINNYAKCDISETPKLHHSFEDIEDIDDGKDVNGNASSCQCRYCDPSGQIWDIDRSCYSPYLTPEHQRKFDFNYETPILPTSLIDSMSSFTLDEGKASHPRSSSSDLEVSTEIVTFLNGHRDLEIKFFSSPSTNNTVRARTNNDNINKNPELCFVNNYNKLVTSEE